MYPIEKPCKALLVLQEEIATLQAAVRQLRAELKDMTDKHITDQVGGDCRGRPPPTNVVNSKFLPAQGPAANDPRCLCAEKQITGHLFM